MKTSSGATPLSSSKARNCFLLNQFATPGLGSLLGRRIAAGIGQLLLSLIGFVLVVIWFLLTMKEYYGLLTSDVPPRSYGRIGLAGALVFVAAWVWAFITSTSLLNEAKEEPPKLT